MAVLPGLINVVVLLITISTIYDLILLRTLAQDTCGYFYTQGAN